MDGLVLVAERLLVITDADAALISNTSDENDLGAGASEVSELGRTYRPNAVGHFLSAGGKFGFHGKHKPSVRNTSRNCKQLEDCVCTY